jgi:hypothetical protein
MRATGQCLSCSFYVSPFFSIFSLEVYSLQMWVLHCHGFSFCSSWVIMLPNIPDSFCVDDVLSLVNRPINSSAVQSTSYFMVRYVPTRLMTASAPSPKTSLSPSLNVLGLSMRTSYGSLPNFCFKWKDMMTLKVPPRLAAVASSKIFRTTLCNKTFFFSFIGDYLSRALFVNRKRNCGTLLNRLLRPSYSLT